LKESQQLKTHRENFNAKYKEIEAILLEKNYVDDLAIKQIIGGVLPDDILKTNEIAKKNLLQEATLKLQNEKINEMKEQLKFHEEDSKMTKKLYMEMNQKLIKENERLLLDLQIAKCENKRVSNHSQY